MIFVINLRLIQYIFLPNYFWYEAEHLETNKLMPDSLTRLTWRLGHLYAGYVLT